MSKLIEEAVNKAVAASKEIEELQDIQDQLMFQFNRVQSIVHDKLWTRDNDPVNEDDPTYPEDDPVLSTLPPTSDDDDEQDAKDDESDHIYDPYAFAEGH